MNTFLPCGFTRNYGIKCFVTLIVNRGFNQTLYTILNMTFHRNSCIHTQHDFLNVYRPCLKVKYQREATIVYFKKFILNSQSNFKMIVRNNCVKNCCE